MRIAAVDDEYHVLERFERMMSHHLNFELCGLFETGAALLTFLKSNPLDLVFLDIEMPEISGLELAEELLVLYPELIVVFVTAYNQYAVDAFELEAVDYILKPLTEARLEKTIQRIKRLKQIKGPKTPENKPMIQCIGDFEVMINGEALVFKHSKAKEILAFLTFKKGIPVNWEKIVDAVWPEYNAEKGQANFHATNYLLRKRLQEAGLSQIIHGGRGGYRLVTDRVDCDIYQLETLLDYGNTNRKGDRHLIDSLLTNGYMEGSGYAWAQPKSAELEEICRKYQLRHKDVPLGI